MGKRTGAMPTLLARITADIDPLDDLADLAQGLGCLELDEEDLALCSYVCPGKTWAA